MLDLMWKTVVLNTIGKLTRLVTNPWTMALATAVGLFCMYHLENAQFAMPFSISLVFLLGSLLFLFTRRLAFSFYTAWAIIAFVASISLLKFMEQGFDLHAYDISFSGGDSSLLSFLIANYGHLAIPVLLAITAGVIGLLIVGFTEKPKQTRLPIRLVLPVAFFGLLPLTIPEDAVTQRHEYMVGGHHVSAFFVSLLDIAEMGNKNTLANHLAELPKQPPLETDTQCTQASEQPDVFFVLSESQAPPAIFPKMDPAHRFDDEFESQNGRTGPLTVETYGGGTWISTFSLMTGLSAADFGWLRPYLTVTLMDRIKGSLPELMAECGYRTVAVLPMDYTFVNEGPFLKSIGFETVLDGTAIGAPSGHQRDNYYFDVSKKLIAEHREKDGRPLFFMLQTMFPHGPYNKRLAPEIKVPGEPFTEQATLNEYLRRLAISRSDLRDFLASLEAQPTDRGTVVLEFGDHQSVETKPFAEQIEGTGILANWDSRAYKTHFTTHAFDYEFSDDVPQFDRLDISYLGTTFRQMAKLPSTPMLEDLAALRDKCEGRFHTCPDRDAVDRHLRRRMDAGLLDISEGAPSS